MWSHHGVEEGFLLCLVGRALGEDAVGCVLLLHHQGARCAVEDTWQALTLDHVHLHFSRGAGLSLMTNVDEDHYCALEGLHVGGALMVHIILYVMASCRHGLMRIHMMLLLMTFPLWTSLASHVMVHMMRYLSIGTHRVAPS